jgi:hypothetical protein
MAQGEEMTLDEFDLRRAVRPISTDRYTLPSLCCCRQVSARLMHLGMCVCV